MSETKVPAIPSLNGITDSAIRSALSAIKEILEVRDGRRGDNLDQFVKVRDITDAGIAVFKKRGTGGSNSPLALLNPPDYTTPPALTNFAVTGGYQSMFIEWDYLGPLNYASFSHVEVWRSPTDEIGTAALLGETTANLFTDPCGSAQTFYYWARAVSKWGVAGPFNAVRGTLGSTAIDVEYLLEKLNASITESQLYKDLGSRIDLIDGPETLRNSVAARVAALRSDIAPALDDALSRVAALEARDLGILNSLNDIITVNGGQTSEIALERLARIDGDEANLSQLNAVQAAIQGNLATVASQMSALANADIAIGQRIDQVSATVEQSQALIANESNARVTADNAIASNIEAVRATLAGNIAGVASQVAALVSGTQSLAQQIDTIIVTNSGQTSDISLERTARIQGDEANAALIQSVQSSMSSSIAAVQQRVETLAAADTATATRIDAVVTDLAGTKAGLTNEVTARSDGDKALATSISNLSASTGSSISAITTRVEVLESNDLNLAKRIDALIVTTGGTTSDIYLEQQTRIAADSALATQITGLSSRLDTTNASIVTEQTARASGDKANADALVAYKAEVAGNYATIASLNTTRSDLTSSIASTTSQLAARLNNPTGDSISMEQKFTAQASINTGLRAQYTVKIDNNGYVTGFGLASTSATGTPTSEFYVRADRFAVGSPGQAQITPFVVTTTPTVINGVEVPAGVYMDGAFIRNGTITNAKIGVAAIDDAKIANLSAAKINAGFLSADRIAANSISGDKLIANTLAAKLAQITEAYISDANVGAAEIGFAKIKDDIQSTNYIPQVSGWKISKSASAEFNGGSLVMRSANNGARLEIIGDCIKVYDSSGVLRVKIGNLAA